jgi:signal transduction histidine kinase
MFLRFWRKKRLVSKLLICAILLWLVPLGVMSYISLRHLRRVQEVSLQETDKLLIALSINQLKVHLSKEAKRLSTIFSTIEAEVHLLRSFAQPLLQNPSQFSFRSGSRYRLDGAGNYTNPTDDGNSNLFVPRYRPSLDRVISVTESLDLLLKPLSEREPRMVLGWIVHREGLIRAYPWQNFENFPRGQEIATWPFYFLAGPEHNPGRGEVFTPPYSDPLSNEWMISCLAPVFVNGTHEATVGVDITIQQLLQEIAEIRPTEGSSALLFSDTEIIAASDNLSLSALGLDPASPFYKQSLASSSLPEVRKIADKEIKNGVEVEFLESGGLRAFVGYAAVQPLGWRIVLLIPEEDVLGPAHVKSQIVFEGTERIRLDFVHLLAFALVALAVMGYNVFVDQSRGLRVLLQGIREFGAGKLSHRIPEEGGEFGELSKALNSMAQHLLEKKTELQRVSVEIEQGRKHKALVRLAAGVAHEVNNPLATISTYTQMLLLRSDLPDDVSESMEKIMGEIRRIQDKLGDLLDLSRLQGPVKTEVDPNVLVHDVTDMARHEAAVQGIEICVSLDHNPRALFVDRSGFKQVLWNLLGNAIAAQGKGGRIQVRTRTTSGTDCIPEFILEVEDEGPGIPEEVLPQIFEPFFTTKEVGQGTGLGLAVVHSIVQGHKGRIEVRNLSPEGCCFRVILPEKGEQ